MCANPMKFKTALVLDGDGEEEPELQKKTLSPTPAFHARLLERSIVDEKRHDHTLPQVFEVVGGDANGIPLK